MQFFHYFQLISSIFSDKGLVNKFLQQSDANNSQFSSHNGVRTNRWQDQNASGEAPQFGKVGGHEPPLQPSAGVSNYQRPPNPVALRHAASRPSGPPTSHLWSSGPPQRPQRQRRPNFPDQLHNRPRGFANRPRQSEPFSRPPMIRNQRFPGQNQAPIRQNNIYGARQQLPPNNSSNQRQEAPTKPSDQLNIWRHADPSGIRPDASAQRQPRPLIQRDSPRAGYASQDPRNAVPNIRPPRPFQNGQRPPFPGGSPQPQPPGPRVMISPSDLKPRKPVPMSFQENMSHKMPRMPSQTKPQGFISPGPINNPTTEVEITEDYDEAEDSDTVSTKYNGVI